MTTFTPRDLAELSVATDLAHLAEQAPVMYTVTTRSRRQWATADPEAARQALAAGHTVTPEVAA